MTTAVATPEGVVEYEFSYSRSTGKMRFRYDGDEWLATKFVGQWEFLTADRSAGTMHVRCFMQMQGDTAYCYVPGSTIGAAAFSDSVANAVLPHDHSQCELETQAPFPQGLDTHWRLCWARDLAMNTKDQACWRLRDERSGRLWLVHDYEGVVNINYLDEGSHIFVDGPAWVNEKGIAQFSNPDIEGYDE